MSAGVVISIVLIFLLLFIAILIFATTIRIVP